MPPLRRPNSGTGGPSTSPPSWGATPRPSAGAKKTWIGSPTGSATGSVKKGRAEEVHRHHPAAGGELPPGAPGSHGGRPDAAGGPVDRPDLRADRRSPGRGGPARQRGGGATNAQKERLSQTHSPKNPRGGGGPPAPT